MSALLPELFEGFETRRIDTGEAEIFLRLGGSGPPLLLLHGFPQTHAMWHRVAPALAEHFTLVIPDLRGYGASSVPPSDAAHLAYSKRAMAADMVRVMDQLGYDRFHLAGHDRGGRAAYRLALDHGARVDRLAVLDIVPTYAMWHGMTTDLAMKVYHWLFLAQPEPLPERLIGGDPAFFLEYTMKSWTKGRRLDSFDSRALEHYRGFYAEPERIHATCEDYRAGQSCDLSHDEADRQVGRRIACPILAVWGAGGIPDETRQPDVEDAPLAHWRDWADNVSGFAIDSGHFVAEENPEATASALIKFMTEAA